MNAIRCDRQALAHRKPHAVCTRRFAPEEGHLSPRFLEQGALPLNLAEGRRQGVAWALAPLPRVARSGRGLSSLALDCLAVYLANTRF
jgi:hypothetical protein